MEEIETDKLLTGLKHTQEAIQIIIDLYNDGTMDSDYVGSAMRGVWIAFAKGFNDNIEKGKLIKQG